MAEVHWSFPKHKQKPLSLRPLADYFFIFLTFEVMQNDYGALAFEYELATVKKYKSNAQENHPNPHDVVVVVAVFVASC